MPGQVLTALCPPEYFVSVTDTASPFASTSWAAERRDTVVSSPKAQAKPVPPSLERFSQLRRPSCLTSALMSGPFRLEEDQLPTPRPRALNTCRKRLCLPSVNSAWPPLRLNLENMVAEGGGTGVSRTTQVTGRTGRWPSEELSRGAVRSQVRAGPWSCGLSRSCGPRNGRR